MSFKFNPNLDYQNDAISAVTSLFGGEEVGFSNFSIYDPAKYSSQFDNYGNQNNGDIGVGNNVHLDNDDILANLQSVQKRFNLDTISKSLTKNQYNFAIEMETGTGKTYVYLKTIFELCKQFSFKKFIVLVPSVAIREGVLSSLKMLESHFDYHYKDFPFHYFQYSSDDLHSLLEFARSDKIEIMVMTIQSFDSENKVLNSPSQKHLEQTFGEKPIDIIRKTKPIVIIDEPQSTSASESRKSYIQKLNPLCTLQYSATHKKNEKNIHKVYRLTAVDAYLKKLVKQIEVASVIATNDHNYAYVKLISVKAVKTKITARIELDVRDEKTGQITRKQCNVKPLDNLFDVSGKRELYSNMSIDTILNTNDQPRIIINGNELLVNQSINSFDEDMIKRTQIRKTIIEHFEKEKKLNPQGIKVLSLFFIDKVANYRSWENNEIVQGKFAKWFEEEYELVRKRYENESSIKAINTPVQSVHQGYFAEDAKNHFKNTKGDSQDDIKAYKSIMSDKEYLLNFKNPIRFIFSHSALREGWDNPNVFQICTLNDSVKSDERKRQEIGRGLRICVNQDSDRVYGFETNTLTIMANVSYEDYASQLQKETEQDGGFKFGKISNLSFCAIELQSSSGENVCISEENSKKLFNFYQSINYINDKFEVTDQLKSDITNKSVKVPPEYSNYKSELINYFKTVCGKLLIKNSDDKQKYHLNKRIVDDNPYFKEIWNRIKAKTKYSIQYDTPELIENCAKALKNISIEGVEIEYRKAKISQNTTGITATQTAVDFDYLTSRNRFLPDIISFLQNATNLTRRTIVQILKDSGTLYQFYINPQRYMSESSKIINTVLIESILKGVKYTQINGEEYYLQEVFPDEELEGCLISELVKSDRSVYEYNRYDSSVEKAFAESLQNDSRVLVYFKLPTHKFVIPTPLGDYTPDWAVVVDDNGTNKMYFVIETKGTTEKSGLRGTELLKICFGEKYFNDVSSVAYLLANKYEDFKKGVALSSDDGKKTTSKKAIF